MDNRDFSHLFWSGSSTSSAIHLGETQAVQAVEQEQQPTFTGRATSPRGSENPVLATLYASQAVVTRAPRSAAATRTTISMTTRPMVTRSTEQYSLATDEPVNPSFTSTPFLTATSASQPIAQSTGVLFSTDPPTDTFASLFALQPISFADNQEHLYGGFDSFSDFLDTYLPEGPEAEPIISQPSGHPIPAPVMDSPMRQVSRQDNNPPANPSVSYPGDATGPAPNAVADSGIPLSTPPFQQPLRPKLLQSRVGSPPIRILSKVKVSMCKEHPSDKWLYRSDSKARPFLCGYSGCGRLFKVRSHFREHMFDHTQTSNHRCTYTECGSNRYFRRSRDLKRHIEKVHADQKS